MEEKEEEKGMIGKEREEMKEEGKVYIQEERGRRDKEREGTREKED